MVVNAEKAVPKVTVTSVVVAKESVEEATVMVVAARVVEAVEAAKAVAATAKVGAVTVAGEVETVREGVAKEEAEADWGTAETEEHLLAGPAVEAHTVAVAMAWVGAARVRAASGGAARVAGVMAMAMAVAETAWVRAARVVVVEEAAREGAVKDEAGADMGMVETQAHLPAGLAVKADTALTAREGVARAGTTRAKLEASRLVGELMATMVLSRMAKAAGAHHSPTRHTVPPQS